MSKAVRWDSVDHKSLKTGLQNKSHSNPFNIPNSFIQYLLVLQLDC